LGGGYGFDNGHMLLWTRALNPEVRPGVPPPERLGGGPPSLCPRRRLAAVGPRLPARQDLFNKLLASKAIARAVEDEARSKKISHEKAQQNAIALMEEIAANFSYEMIRLTDRILGFTWNRLYPGLNVHKPAPVRPRAPDGRVLVLAPP
ncbi:hypothetical protein M8371_31310, partial [Klebsiella pneumoniae]|nr:hypothetical protein [Klebsiella pneumoniae]